MNTKRAIAFGMKLGLSEKQARTLARLKTPADVQDFISAIPANFEQGGETCLSVREVLTQRRAHCIEGAFTAACAFWLQGRPPLLLDLRAKGDDDHVVALFRKYGCWGAVSKSNHVWLRWRDPVYRTLRELALSYFHEYATGKSKTLWSYSDAFDLRRFKPEMWVNNDDNCWDVGAALDDIKHYRLISLVQAKNLRAMDRLENKADKLRDFKKTRKGAKRL